MTLIVRFVKVNKTYNSIIGIHIYIIEFVILFIFTIQYHYIIELKALLLLFNCTYNILTLSLCSRQFEKWNYKA